jgi:hypothetical protein
MGSDDALSACCSGIVTTRGPACKSHLQCTEHVVRYACRLLEATPMLHLPLTGIDLRVPSVSGTRPFPFWKAGEMNEELMLELLGYVASALVAISLMMTSIVRLRVINLVGALTFMVYGWLIGAIPVAAVNLFIVLINIYYLNGILRKRELFRVVEVGDESKYLDYFLDFYREQIRRFSPGAPATHRGDLNLLVLRDLVPAGLLMGNVEGHTLRVTVDFVIPQYRDLKVGKYLFDTCSSLFRERGIREIVTPRGSDEHTRYLRRIGFTPLADDLDETSLYHRAVG